MRLRLVISRLSGKLLSQRLAPCSLIVSRYVWQATIEGKYASAELEVLSDLQKRAVQCCQRVWAAVKHVLCDDSPEGHMPQELEDLEGLDTKDLLSYSFRSVHEARYVLSRELS